MRVAQLSLLSGDRFDPILERTVGDALRVAANAWGDQVALQEGIAASGARRWTFNDLLSEAEQTAHSLLRTFPPATT
jgi:fatty-acyl-CoA synthase